MGVRPALGANEPPTTLLVASTLVDSNVRNVDVTPLGEVTWPEPFEYRSESTAILLSVIFTPRTSFAFDRRGILWQSDGSSSQIRNWTGAEWSEPLGPLLDRPAVERDHVEREMDDPRFDELRSIGGRAVSDYLDRIPEQQPAVAAIFFDAFDRPWLMRPRADSRSGHELVHLTRDGRVTASYLSELDADPRPSSNSELLVGVSTDMLGRQSVVVYRLPTSR